MTPCSPVIPGCDLPETVIAKDQPEYQPLPAYVAEDGMVLTRWRLTWRERLLALLRGDVYLFVLTYRHPLQPVVLQIDRPTCSRRSEC